MLPVRNRSSTYSRFNNLFAHKFYSIGPVLLPSRRKSVLSISNDYNDRIKEANYFQDISQKYRIEDIKEKRK